MAALSGRTRNPQGTGGRLRQELIEAAARVLERLPSGTDLSLRAVAREAGVAAPSVYLQFSSKVELIRAVRHDIFEQLRDAILQALAPETDPADRLRTGCLAYCRFALEHPGSYHILFEYVPHDERSLEEFGAPDDAGTRALATLVDAIKDCMEAGIAPEGDPFRRATLVWSAMHGYVMLLRFRGGFPWPPVEVHLEDLLVGLVGIPRRLPEQPPLTPVILAGG